MPSKILLCILLLTASTAMAQQDTLVIHFDLDRADIRPSDKVSLDTLSRGSIAYVILTGHTDSSGSDAYNEGLSLRRAQAVHAYLQARGWPDSLFQRLEGKGRQGPLNDRRTDIIIFYMPRVPAAATAPLAPSVLKQAFTDTTHLVGQKIVLSNVNFYPGSHDPLPEAFEPLNELVGIMQQHPALRIEIQGYICCFADWTDSMDKDGQTHLSVARAKVVYDYLVGKGIVSSRMSYKGFGAGNKIYPQEETEEQRVANRRVEIKIVSMGTR